MAELGTYMPVGGCGGRWVLRILFIWDRLSRIVSNTDGALIHKTGVWGSNLVTGRICFY
jgi:hypothetical protein